MTWVFDSGLVCLLGPGDATKTTVLDAISLVLSPRWSVQITDADFYECDTSDPITITATVTGLPKSLIAEDALGLMKRGVAPDGTIHDEPEDDDDVALTVRFEVGSDLEPSWFVVKEAVEDRRISARQRSALGVFRLDDRHNYHLGWGRASALSVRTKSGGDVSDVLASAQREARQAVFDHPCEALTEISDETKDGASTVGAADYGNLRPGLDPSVFVGGVALVLHDGEVPLTSFGLGTRRLTSLSIQQAALEGDALVLIDEVEHALEPHRLFHLLRQIVKRAESGAGQVILTTHSPLVLEHLDSHLLHLVRSSSEGKTSIQVLPPQLEEFRVGEPQKTVRSGPSAMLARRVVVTEGPTELGLCLGLLDKWDQEASQPAAIVGTAFRDGKGAHAPTKARCLAELGYPTLLFIDSDDTSTDEEVGRCVSAGVTVARWVDPVKTETRLAQDLPMSALGSLLALAIDLNETDDPVASIRDSINARLSDDQLTGTDPEAWVDSDVPEEPLRNAIAEASAPADKKKAWFKTQSRGLALGKLISNEWDGLGGTDLRAQLEAVQEFVYRVTEG